MLLCSLFGGAPTRTSERVMGAAQSNKEFVDSQLALHRRSDALVLGDVLETQPPREYALDLQHLGTVYAVDADHEGVFKRDAMLRFANFYCLFRAAERSVDSDSKFQAYCTLRLWNDLSREHGVDDFVAWVTRLVLHNDQAVFAAKHHSPTPSAQPTPAPTPAAAAAAPPPLPPQQPKPAPAATPAKAPAKAKAVVPRLQIGAAAKVAPTAEAPQKQQQPQQQQQQQQSQQPQQQQQQGVKTQTAADPMFVSWDTMRDLHKLFSVRHGLGLDLPSFFDMLQRAAEEQDAVPAEGDKYDGSVPLSTVAEFARQFALGFVSFLSDLGFVPGIPLDK